MLFEKIRYTQRKQKKQAVAINCEGCESIESNPEETEELIKYFNDCLLPRDKVGILNKMKESAAVRKNSNQTNRLIFDSSFHLYRVDSSLVCLFFT